jgi:hypothetical protein
MSHYLWNDCENTYVITGRLGERILAIRQVYDGADRRRFVSIDDDIKPNDIVFVENLSWDCLFAGFRVFIAGKYVDVIHDDPTVSDIHFMENEYVKPANMLSKLGRAAGVNGPDEVIMQTILTKLECLNILEDYNLLDLVRKCYAQSNLIDKLKKQTSELMSNYNAL